MLERQRAMFPVPPIPRRTEGLGASSGAKRRRKNALPAPFLMVSKGEGTSRKMYGVVEFESVQVLTDDRRQGWQYELYVENGGAVQRDKYCVWEVSMCAPCPEAPHACVKPDFRYEGLVCLLTPEAEERTNA